MSNDGSVRVLAVDLAARFSAAAVVVSSESDHYKMVWQRDSSVALALTEGQLRATEPHPSLEDRWVTQVRDTAYLYDLDAIAVEDMPHGVRFDSTAKHVARMQGRVYDRLKVDGMDGKLWFVPPALWQRSFPGVWRMGPAGQRAAAESLGYSPPEFGPSLVGRGTGPARAVARKIQTDYVSAFLIGGWACKTVRDCGSLDVPSCQRYNPMGFGETKSADS